MFNRIAAAASVLPGDLIHFGDFISSKFIFTFIFSISIPQLSFGASCGKLTLILTLVFTFLYSLSRLNFAVGSERFTIWLKT